MNKQFDYIKEYLKKDSRLVVLHPDTKSSHKEMEWDVLCVLENFVHRHHSLEIIQEYTTGNLNIKFCHLNTSELSEGKINVDIYAVKEKY